MKRYFILLSTLLLHPLCLIAEDFDFGDDNDTNISKNEVTIPIRGKIGIENGRQYSQDATRWIKLGPSANFFLDWHTSFGTIYSESSYIHNIAYRTEKDSSRTIDHYENYGEVRELYFKRSNSTYSLTLGRSIIVWGKNDLFSILDVASPLDQSELFFAKPEDARTGQDSMKLDLYMTQMEISIIYTPKPRMNIIPQKEHPYNLLHYNKESKNYKPEYGVEISKEFNRYSLSLSAGSFYYRDPLLTIPPYSEEPIITYEKRSLVGLSLVTTIDPVLVLFELAYYKDQPYQALTTRNTPSPIPVIKKKNTKAASLGIDYSHTDLGNFTVEGSTLRPDNPKDEIDTEHFLGFLWSKNFLNDDMQVSFTQMITDSIKNQIMRGSISYTIIDDLRIYLQYTYIKFNERDEVYKLYSKLDRFDFGVHYDFDFSR